MFGIMLAFEATKVSILPKLSMWESHAVTISFTTVISAFLAAIMQRRSMAARSALASAHAIIEHELDERRRLRDMMELLQTISSRTELNTFCVSIWAASFRA
jgi:hypothetical protein